MSAQGASIARRATIAASAILSCLVFYPFVHECGHLLPAKVSGAEVNTFIWTPLLGRTHVSLNNVPGPAMPWVDAGGILLPTIVGTMMMAIWLSLPLRVPNPLWRIWLLIPGGILLLGNFGLILEMIMQSNTLDHMHGLAQLIGGNGLVAMIVELLPALWSCIVIACTIRHCRRRKQVAPEPKQTT
jgi:hypothetical protein